MSKNNMLLGYARGKVGDLVFARRKGQQITRAYNPNPQNPKTNDQMTQRTKLAGLVNMYRCLRIILNHSFTNLKEGQTSYNAFVSANMAIAPFLTKEQSQKGVVVVLPYVVSRGTLNRIFTSGSGDQAYTNIGVGELEITDETTIAELSDAIVSNNAGWQYGDQLSYISVIQTSNEGDAYDLHGVAQEFKITLDNSNTDTVRNYLPDYASVTVNGFIGHGTHFASGGFCWIHSRKDEMGNLMVSTQNLICNIDNSAWQQSEQEETAKRSYRYQEEPYLVPGLNAESPANIGTEIVEAHLMPGLSGPSGASVSFALSSLQTQNYKPSTAEGTDPWNVQLYITGNNISTITEESIQVQVSAGVPRPTQWSGALEITGVTNISATESRIDLTWNPSSTADAWTTLQILFNGEQIFLWDAIANKNM